MLTCIEDEEIPHVSCWQRISGLPVSHLLRCKDTSRQVIVLCTGYYQFWVAVRNILHVRQMCLYQYIVLYSYAFFTYAVYISFLEGYRPLVLHYISPTYQRQ